MQPNTIFGDQKLHCKTKGTLPAAGIPYLSRRPKENFTFDSKYDPRFERLQSVPFGAYCTPCKPKHVHTLRILSSRRGRAPTTWVTGFSPSDHRGAGAEGVSLRRGAVPAQWAGLGRTQASDRLSFTFPLCLRPSSRHVMPRFRACASPLKVFPGLGGWSGRRVGGRRWRRPRSANVGAWPCGGQGKLSFLPEGAGRAGGRTSR